MLRFWTNSGILAPSLTDGASTLTIIEIFQTFQTQDQAIEYLESVRWHGEPTCPYCGADGVSRHASTDRKRSRWQCHECRRAFSVTVGTIFHGTHVALRDWFILLALMLNAKKSVSSCQAARDLGMRRQTVWTMMHRIRIAMANDQEQASLFQGILETEKAYVGEQPRTDCERDPNDASAKPVPEADEQQEPDAIKRDGDVVGRPAKPRQLNTAGRSRFLESRVERTNRPALTTELGGDKRITENVLHEHVHHCIENAGKDDGFWGLVKRAWYGTHHHYSRKYMVLYIAEAYFKFNQRHGAPDLRAALEVAVG